MDYYSHYLNPTQQKLMSDFQNHQERIAKLEAEQQKLRTELDQLKGQKRTHVEKIEYKFDQLKVERLEGTLHIGVSPEGSGSIEELALNDQSMQDLSFPSDPSSEEQQMMRQRLKKQIHQYIHQEVPDQIRRYNDRYHCVLGDAYAQQMVDELYSQMDERIKTYQTQKMKSSFIEEQNKSAETEIFELLKQDIHKALVQHYDQLKKKGAY